MFSRIREAVRIITYRDPLPRKELPPPGKTAGTRTLAEELERLKQKDGTKKDKQ